MADEAELRTNLATPFEAGSFDVAVVTSRMDGLRSSWGDGLAYETHRIARQVWLRPEGADRLVRDRRDTEPLPGQGRLRAEGSDQLVRNVTETEPAAQSV